MLNLYPAGPATSGNTARNALPSASLGNAAATRWLLPDLAPIRFHIGMKHSTRCSAPRKYITTYFGFHGTFEHTSGVPSVSACEATALTVSGVEEASSMSTLSDWIACLASCPARDTEDWLS